MPPEVKPSVPTALSPAALFFDHNATTPLAPEVLEEMMPFLTEEFGNASTVYPLGVNARYGVEKARRRVAKAIGAQPEEIVFTGGGSESDNLAIKGVALAQRGQGRHIVSCPTEHEAVLEPLRWLESRFGFEVTWLPPGRSGRIDPDDLARALRPDTALVTLMFANNETGVLHPVAEIGRITRERGVLFHTDAIQAVGKEPIDVHALGIDLLSLSAHKVYGPKGVGALFVRSGVAIEPLVHGGHHERGLRAGTENVAGIVGLGKALEIAAARREAEMARERALKARLAERLLAALDGVEINGDQEHCLAGTLNVGIAGISGPRLVGLAAAENLCIAAGSACRTGETASSHVLTAMGLPAPAVEGAVRLSLGRGTTEAAVDHLAERLAALVRQLRGEG